MTSTALAQRFEEHRPHLLAVGYRLTGSVADAEDAVQESWIRLSSTGPDSVRDLRGWLTTVVGRICLDRLRSAAVRRESYVGQWLPEPVVTEPHRGAPDPLDALVGDEDARLAAMVVLDTLSPPQRIAFVLHDGFAVPFDEIATMLGVSTAAARQYASRGRKAVARAPKPVAAAEHDAAVERVLAALATGDVDAVVAALHPEAIAVGDAGGTTSTAMRPILGPDKIARFFLGLGRKLGNDNLRAARPVWVNGALGLYLPGLPRTEKHQAVPVHINGFAVADGRVIGIYDFANPAKFAGVRVPGERTPSA
ncbi:sigma-70 family RNA polymerase sigma factor [Aldersonia sp. NBC_00410]|uniref:sigma-70 family RNA polymerase sigma factor n=1 Tax=Aldersonia sp. NBC_00410 TaxID=2975954 RepID=UPI0022539324|nr:sigma-70 family RNA polymerase sigma factor [Aldersonia sp. NBC_00410]MCX5045685.1 sigma-70 family RNA polymerase sigma factor [Aldersonia sp. NBC_00410]